VNDARDLTLILRARFPLVAIQTHEESRATPLLERICSLAAQNFDLARLAATADGFSGAEIAEAVVASLHESHPRGRAMDTALIAEEIARTRPLSVLMAERIAALREWAVGRAVMAG
jgi:hypothetical protein